MQKTLLARKEITQKKTKAKNQSVNNREFCKGRLTNRLLVGLQGDAQRE